jgi:hypothetical protein
MAQVLLQRDFRTPHGRFERSVEGVPTEIPEIVLKRYPLPKDAEICGPDYLTPEQQRIEDELNAEDGVAKTAAEIENEINERVNAELDRREAERKAKSKPNEAEDETADETNGVTVDPAPGSPDPDHETDDDNDDDGGDDILDLPVKDIAPQLVDMEYDELQDLLAREKAGKTRSTLVEAIEEAMEEFEDE